MDMYNVVGGVSCQQTINIPSILRCLAQEVALVHFVCWSLGQVNREMTRGESLHFH